MEVGNLNLTNKCVTLCIYITPRVFRSDIAIMEDVRTASAIWAQCEIEFRIKKRFTPDEVPELRSFTFFDKDITFTGDLAKAPNTGANIRLKELLSIRPECDETEIAVYYVGGNTFSDGVTTSGFYLQGLNAKNQFSIVLTNGATSDHFAHELGHALFVRDNSTDYNDPFDPDPNDPIHNIRECNLMHKSVKGINIDKRQCVLPKNSSLLKEWSPPSDLFRKITINGSLFIRDDDSTVFNPPNAADKELHDIEPKVLKLGPFNTFDIYTSSNSQAFNLNLEPQGYWNEYFTDEVAINIGIRFSWSIDSTVTVKIEMILFEDDEASPFYLQSDDLDGKITRSFIIPKDAKDKKVELKVSNYDENELNTFGKLELFISNEIDLNP